MLAAAHLRIGARRLRALACDDAEATRAWLASDSAWRLAEARRDARAAYDRVLAAGARVVALGYAGYPSALRDLRDPPAFLVVRGTLGEAPAGGSGTAVVGTRTPDSRAVACARALARTQAPPIVSGLAAGIDAAAHRGALDAGAPTIAYVGHGIGATSPPENAALEDAIVAAGGAVASERLPGESATRWSLVRRDRLQAAHARRIVLVQSEAGGGAMHAMDAARLLGRERWALVPGVVAGDSGGNEQALADGAHALDLEALASWNVTL